MENITPTPAELESQMIKEYHKGQPYAIVMLFGVVVCHFVIGMAILVFVVSACSFMYDVIKNLL